MHIISKVSNDCQQFNITIKEAKISKLIREIIEEEEEDDDSDCEDEMKTINIIKVSGDVLQYIVEYAKYYVIEAMDEIESPLKSVKVDEIVQPWYAEFIQKVYADGKLFQLVTAANYMNIQELLQLACLKVATTIKGKSQEQIREIFGLSPELTAEERKQIEEENKWVR